MTQTRVLAIDPGKTTGYAFGLIDDETKEMEIDAWQRADIHLEFYNNLWRADPHHIVCESFEFRQGKQRTGLELYSKELIGVLNLFHQREALPPRLWFQTAAKGKGYFDNSRLRELGIYITGQEHTRDAIRHLMQWITFEAGYRLGVKRVALASILSQPTKQPN
jgi:hypothetical protein